MKFQFNEKDFEYFDYIFEHKKNIMKAFNILMSSDFFDQPDKLSMGIILKKRTLEHDLIKLSPKEFEPYRRKFFPREDPNVEVGDCDICFKDAWKHHYNNERHHPEKYNSEDTMEPIDIIEMCLDWYAMSMKFNDDVLKYYNNKKEELKKKHPWLIENYDNLITQILKKMKEYDNLKEE